MGKTEVWERDGKKCFYCGTPLTLEEATHEHILAKAHGGTNHDYNCTVACKPCNTFVGSLPVVDKIKHREVNMGFTNKDKRTVLTVGNIRVEVSE